jgi:hypothetical protein
MNLANLLVTVMYVREEYNTILNLGIEVYMYGLYIQTEFLNWEIIMWVHIRAMLVQQRTANLIGLQQSNM